MIREMKIVPATTQGATTLVAMALGAIAILAGCATTAPGDSIITTTPAGGTESIPTQVIRPEGAGPFPAVVILHDCSGLGPRSSGAPGRWAGELVRAGYVVIMPDSFSTRGFASGVCTDPSSRRSEVGPVRRLRDAYAALAHARTLSYVDNRRVGLMGGSHGGTSTLVSMRAPQNDREALAPERRAGFAAGIALYPACPTQLLDRGSAYRPIAPLLILTGEKDDWTPAAPCQQLTERGQAAGLPMSIKVYPGAHHAFDNHSPVRYVPNRVNANSPSGYGATTGGDSRAWADSIREVLAFFAGHLR